MNSRRTFLSIVLVLAAVSVTSADDWQTLYDCTLIPSPNNFGDSFHCNCDGKEYVFRLYSIDAPEIDDRFENRVSDQARYFGITEEQVIEIGKQAKEFAASVLGTNTFTVITRGQSAGGQNRIGRSYAFINVNGDDLSLKLVENGLARIYGVTVTPTGMDKSFYEQVLVSLENQAKKGRLGAWALNTGGIETNGYQIPLEAGYRITKSGVRHNAKCRYYDSPSAVPCGKDDGRPCKICGG
jgi:endonuclease YncB( thermonuclease family)